MAVMTNGQICCFSSCAEDMEIKAAQGWRELTVDKIASAGMLGYEPHVSPLNTRVNADGSITFTPALPSEAELFESLRIATESRLAATDKYATVDYPDGARRDTVLAHRAALRALNRQKGAPWDGGGDETPWPELPTVE